MVRRIPKFSTLIGLRYEGATFIQTKSFIIK